MYSALSRLSTAIFGRFSFCAKIGAIIGILAGSLFALVQSEFAGVSFANDELLWISLLLALLGWVVVLVIVGVWLRYGPSAIAVAALVNALLTSLVTVFLANAMQQPALTPLLGLIVGLLIGTLLCYLCGRWLSGKYNLVTRDV